MTGPISDIFALTSAQAGLLMSSLIEPAPGLYVVQMRFALNGHLDPDRIEHAWQTLTARHDVLRTAIAWDKTSKPVNVVMTETEVPITWLDLSELQRTARDEAVQAFLTDDRRRGFDLQRAPLSRVTIFNFGDGAWEMVWTHHHVILDGWSTAELAEELWRSYTGRALPPQPPRFRDFASALASATERYRVRNQAYWHKRITGGAALLPADRPRADSTPGVWTDCALDVPHEQLVNWYDAARRHGTTPSTLYHASWALTLRASGLTADELVLGTVVDTRGIDGADVIGLCVASMPMRVVFDDTPIGEWLRGVAVERANAHEHAAVNLAEYRTWSKDHAEAPFRYLLAVEGYPHDALTRPDTGAQLTVRYLGVHESTEYALTAGVPAGTPRLKLTFDTRRIAAATAVALLDQWASILDTLAATPSETSLTEILNADPPVCTTLTLPQRISQLAREHPDRPAFRDAVSSLELGALDRASKRVSGRLRTHGLHPGQRVGILVDDDVAVATGILAILAAGGVVVPLDPRHPAPYRAAVISTAQVRYLLTSHPDARPEWDGTKVLAISELLTEAADGEDGPASSDDLAQSHGQGPAFLVHDSGSAVHPVATSYDQGSVLDVATALGAWLGLKPNDEWLVTRPAAGAAAPAEMWAAPLRGGCTIIAPGIQHNPDELARLTARGTVAVVGVTEREARELNAMMGPGRGRLVSATRVGRELTLWSAAGDMLGTVGEPNNHRTAAGEMVVDGVSVDPAHLEGLLRSQADVTSCVVRQEPDGTLQAVVGTASSRLSVRDLTKMLRSSLPEEMVPRVVCAQAALFTPTPRQQQVECEVAQLWSEVLERREIPLDTPFFDLGGHSLLLFAVLRGLKDRGWANLQMTDLLANPTVRTLSRLLCQPDPDEQPQPTDRRQHRRGAMAARRERGRT